MIKWLKNLFTHKTDRPIALLKVSKKDADYAHAMHFAETIQDESDSRDFGEAYDFHMDCGDR
jgi:hypothetical protein